jgi:hypothetical protein
MTSDQKLVSHAPIGTSPMVSSAERSFARFDGSLPVIAPLARGQLGAEEIEAIMSIVEGQWRLKMLARFDPPFSGKSADCHPTDKAFSPVLFAIQNKNSESRPPLRFKTTLPAPKSRFPARTDTRFPLLATSAPCAQSSELRSAIVHNRGPLWSVVDRW